MSSISKDPLEAYRKNEWPFCHDEFDAWPAHMRPPMHLRSQHLAFDPLTATALVLSAVGTGLGAAGTIAGGQNAAAMGRFQQGELNQQGETAEATGQRAMLEERRKAGLVESTLQARAAAGGGSATAPSTLNLSGQIAKRGEYNALMDLSQGQNQQAGLEGQGEAALYGGKVAQVGDEYSAAGTIASGAGSFARTLQFGSGSLPQYSTSNPLTANYGGY